MKEIPMGPPSDRPEPKSGCAFFVAPMVATLRSEWASTGNLSTGLFQTLLAGKTMQVAMRCWAWAVKVTTASATDAIRDPIRHAILRGIRCRFIFCDIELRKALGQAGPTPRES